MSDITYNPDRTNPARREMQYQGLQREAPVAGQQMQQMQQMQAQAAHGVQCPYCGTVNDPDALFCASCGQPLGKVSCPNCGAEIDPDADFCETCHHYIRMDVCSFCGARLTGQEAFCPECGNPRGGIVCPVCNTLNSFSFCRQCGTALTVEAKQLQAELHKTPEFKEMQELASELQQLDMSLPFTSEKDVVKERLNQQLRQRVLTLLAQDKGIDEPVAERPSKRLSKEEFDAKKQARINRLTALLEKMALPAQPQPAQVRNYAMACKPQGVRLAWECNWKHALHSSPCGCAKPQQGGKWIILGKNTRQEVKDDK